MSRPSLAVDDCLSSPWLVWLSSSLKDFPEVLSHFLNLTIQIAKILFPLEVTVMHPDVRLLLSS